MASQSQNNANEMQESAKKMGATFRKGLKTVRKGLKVAKSALNKTGATLQAKLKAIKGLFQLIAKLATFSPPVGIIILAVIVFAPFLIVLAALLWMGILILAKGAIADLKNAVAVKMQNVAQQKITDSYITYFATQSPEQIYATLYENVYKQMATAFETVRKVYNSDVVNMETFMANSEVKAIYKNRSIDDIVTTANSVISSVYRNRNDWKYKNINAKLSELQTKRLYSLTDASFHSGNRYSLTTAAETLQSKDIFNQSGKLSTFGRWIVWTAMDIGDTGNSAYNKALTSSGAKAYVGGKYKNPRFEDVLGGEYIAVPDIIEAVEIDPIASQIDQVNASTMNGSYYQPCADDKGSPAKSIMLKPPLGFVKFINEEDNSVSYIPIYEWSWLVKGLLALINKPSDYIISGETYEYNGKKYPVYSQDLPEAWYKSSGSVEDKDKALIVNNFVVVDPDLTIAANMSWYFESKGANVYKRYSLFDNYMNYLIAAASVACTDNIPSIGWINFLDKTIGLCNQNNWFDNLAHFFNTGNITGDTAGTNFEDIWSLKQFFRTGDFNSGVLFVPVDNVKIILKEPTESNYRTDYNGASSDSPEPALLPDLKLDRVAMCNTDVGTLISLPGTKIANCTFQSADPSLFETIFSSYEQYEKTPFSFTLGYYFLNNSIDLDRLLWSMFTSSAATATGDLFDKEGGISIEGSSMYSGSGSFYSAYAVFEPVSVVSSANWFEKVTKKVFNTMQMIFLGKTNGDKAEIRYYLWGLPIVLDENNYDYFEIKWGIYEAIGGTQRAKSGGYLLDRNMDSTINHEDYAGVMNEPYHTTHYRVLYRCSNNVNPRSRHNLMHDGIKNLPENEAIANGLLDLQTKINTTLNNLMKSAITTGALSGYYALSSIPNIIEAFADAVTFPALCEQVVTQAPYIHCSFHDYFCGLKVNMIENDDGSTRFELDSSERNRLDNYQTESIFVNLYCPLCFATLNPEAPETKEAMGGQYASSWAENWPCQCPDCLELMNNVSDELDAANLNLASTPCLSVTGKVQMEIVRDGQMEFTTFMLFEGGDDGVTYSAAKTAEEDYPDDAIFDGEDFVEFMENKRVHLAMGPDNDPIINITKNYNRQKGKYTTDENGQKYLQYLKSSSTDEQVYMINRQDFTNAFWQQQIRSERATQAAPNLDSGTITVEEISTNTVKSIMRSGAKEVSEDGASKTDYNFDMMVVGISDNSRKMYEEQILDENKTKIQEVLGPNYALAHSLWIRSTEYDPEVPEQFNKFLKAVDIRSYLTVPNTARLDEDGNPINERWYISPKATGGAKLPGVRYISEDKNFTMKQGLQYVTVEMKIFEKKLSYQGTVHMNSFYDGEDPAGNAPSIDSPEGDSGKGLYKVTKPNNMGMSVTSTPVPGAPSGVPERQTVEASALTGGYTKDSFVGDYTINTEDDFGTELAGRTDGDTNYHRYNSSTENQLQSQAALDAENGIKYQKYNNGKLDASDVKDPRFDNYDIDSGEGPTNNKYNILTGSYWEKDEDGNMKEYDLGGIASP